MGLLSLSAMATPPTVTTNKRFARGATMAFGRLTVSGTGIKERGFCYAETPNPTVDDMKTSKAITNKGAIYWLQDLKPATKYYMRAYAINNSNEVGYGDVIKFYTIPKGTIGLNMRTSGDENSNRIKAAAETAVNWWNNLTEIKGFSTSIGYNSGTPTAECSYGGWMSVGPNTSYQRCGTIMHELLHGVGVIPWADTEWSRVGRLRAGVNGDGKGTGQWLGDRVTEVLTFLENTETHLNGDYQHMWPYGINGASEDNGSDALYIGNGLVCQALGEDGLQHTSSLFAEPYYALDQEDDVKFYIKNESADRGLYSSFLMPNAAGALRWVEMTAEQAEANDSAAWYFTFTPSNQYYQIKNAATGKYITYNSNVIKTLERESLTANDNWHLMKGRVDVSGLRGYWIIHPESSWTPKCLQGNVNGATTAATFNIANTAETQRWLIMTLDEMKALDSKSTGSKKKEALALLEHIKDLKNVAHKEVTEGSDATFETAISAFETRIEGAKTPDEVVNIISEMGEAALTFLQGVTATDSDHPFDLTYMMTNPTVDENTDGWSASATVNYGCAEFYENTFNFYQILKPLPSGSYKFCVQGFQRPGKAADAYNDYVAGTDNVSAKVYIASSNTSLAHIATGAQTQKVGGNESTVGNNMYIPNNMQAASLYFKKGLYENSVETELATANGQLRMGVRASPMSEYYWVIFDNFRLYFYGQKESDPEGISTIGNTAPQSRNVIFTLDGRQLPANSQLRPGLYIKDGKKIVVR
jgi:hypothetical protein